MVDLRRVLVYLFLAIALSSFGHLATGFKSRWNADHVTATRILNQQHVQSLNKPPSTQDVKPALAAANAIGCSQANISGGVSFLSRWAGAKFSTGYLDEEGSLIRSLDSSSVIEGHTDARHSASFHVLSEGTSGVVASFRNAFVSGVRLCIFDCSLMYFPGGCTLGPSAGHSCSLRDFTINLEQPTRVSSLKRAILIARQGQSIFHWMLESLQQLALVIDNVHADPSVTILVYEWVPKYLELFEWLGVDKSRVIALGPPRNLGEIAAYKDTSSCEVFFVEELNAPSSGPCGSVNYELVQRIRAMIEKPLQQISLLHEQESGLIKVEGKMGTVLIVKRTGATRRFVEFDDTIAALEASVPSRTFKVFLGNESLERTVTLFQEADVVVGIHGGGLCNILFARSGTVVVELFPRYMQAQNMFQGLAESLGQKYIRVLLDRGSIYDAEIPVSAEVIVDVLKGLL